jgi:serine/threonine protein kinase
VTPNKIGRYIIKEKLGQGGMAAVYRAHDPNFKRDVAIKVLPPAYLDNQMFRARFEREAQMIAALEYPGIVPVYDFGEQDGQPYLVMRYMPGGSLADRITEHPLTIQEAVNIFNRLAPALDHVHAQGIIHRDLKPANILFDQYDTAWISDFGIARLTEGAISLTGESLIGTPAYMSPEQAQGIRELDGRSDIYALGAILFEILTGKQPYEATTPMGVILKHLTDPIPRLLAVKADLPDVLEAIIARSMQKDREQRYPNAAAMLADLNNVLASHPPAFVTDTPVEPSARRITWPAPSRPGIEDEAETFLETSSQAEPAGSGSAGSGTAGPSATAGPSNQPGMPAGYKPAGSRSQPQLIPAQPAGSASASISKPTSRPTIKTQRKLSTLPLALVALLAGIGCLGLLLVGGWVASNFLLKTPEPSQVAQVTNTLPETTVALATETVTPPDTTTGIGDVNTTNSSGKYADDFSDPESGWLRYEGSDGILAYDSGYYRIQVNLTQTLYLSVPGFSADDSSIAVEAYKSGGPDENVFGIVCRYQDDFNYYFLVIGSDGYYGIGKVVDGSTSLVGSAQLEYSQAINQGRTSNDVRADCDGTHLSLFANGTLLTTEEDDDFSAGMVGLLAGTYSIQGVDILFDNFSVTPIKKP